MDGAVLFQGKVFVALPGESGEPILSWVLEHTSSSAEIIIMHIRQKQSGLTTIISSLSFSKIMKL